jgi:predicted ABC-type ATPase
LSSIKYNPSLRLRVFAGPNGSGKSTIIQAVREYRVKSIPVDFGIYVNADDIATCLLTKTFSFSNYSVRVTDEEFFLIIVESGLINKNFTLQQFKAPIILLTIA